MALDRTALLANLRRARKGAAPGPTSLTAEMLRLVLDAEESSQAFGDVAVLGRASVPEPIAAALAIGRLVAMRKPNGGTRGLVVGDSLRPVVAGTLAQQFAAHFQRACLPHQHALKARAGSEALVHVLQARTQLDSRLRLVSVDVTAAYDLISRQAMLQALRRTPEASALLPFMRLWYARAGPEVHRISHAEGGEQGDPLVPVVFSLGIAPALSALQHELREGEHAVAYLDDICLLCQPDRVVPLYQRLENYFGNMPASASKQPKLECGMKLALHPLVFRPSPLTPPSGSVTTSSPKLSRVPSSWECRSGLQPMLTTICPTSLTAKVFFASSSWPGGCSIGLAASPLLCVALGAVCHPHVAPLVHSKVCCRPRQSH